MTPAHVGDMNMAFPAGPTREPHCSPLLYTPTDAADLLAVPESWLRRNAGRRKIPCTFIGKHLRFSTADLAAISAAGSQPALQPRRLHGHH